MAEKEKGKKVVWYSPESCDITDKENVQDCVLDKINKVTHKRASEEIIAVSNFNQPHKGDLATRIAVMKRPMPAGLPEYSTHLLTYEEDGTIALYYGHHDMTLEEAMADLRKRAAEEKAFIYRRKSVPPHL